MGGNPLAINARTVAPLAAVGATWVARKGMTKAYEDKTGHVPPKADDREIPLSKVIMWAVASAMVAATIDVIINRLAAKVGDKQVAAAEATTN